MSTNSKEKKLTDKEKRFVDEYCVDCNAKQAAIRAGYSEKSAKEIGYENLTKPHLKAVVAARLEELSMSAAEATKRLTDWGRGTFDPFVKNDPEYGLVVDLSTVQSRENIGLIKKLKQYKKVTIGEGGPQSVEYTTEIELHDAKDAVVQIAKIRQLYIQNIKVDSTLTVDDARAALAKELTKEQE